MSQTIVIKNENIHTKETNMQIKSWVAASLMILGAGAITQTPVFAAECTNRGDLDTLFCDANNDMVADPPH
jgi:phosphonate transport system substrate-binding protein